MTKEEFITKVWNYYLMLEKDFMNTFHFKWLTYPIKIAYICHLSCILKEK